MQGERATNTASCMSDCLIPECKPSLIIEVHQVRDHIVAQHELEHRVESWLRKNFAQVKAGQLIDFRTLTCKNLTRKIYVAGPESTSFPLGSFHRLAEFDLQFYFYSLFAGDDDGTSWDVFGDESTQYSVTRLPHEKFEMQWDGLVFEDAVAEDALRTILRGMNLRKHARWETLFRTWRPNILLYGPPGTGKTDLAHALAQKLAIRLDDMYEEICHIQIHGHALLSKYFGESPKVVGQLFDSVVKMASLQGNLVIVTFDEVETIAGSRERATENSEVEDGLRSTNEFLRGLDRLNELSNVIFFATSNLIANIDEAFLDRFSIQRLIGHGGLHASYEILRAKLNALIKCKCVHIIAGDGDEAHNARQSLGDEQISDTVKTHVRAQSSYEEPLQIPPWPVNFAQCHPAAKSAAEDLHKVAKLTGSLSARSIEGCLQNAIGGFTSGTVCALSDVLSALSKVLEQRGGSAMLGSEISSELVPQSQLEPMDDEACLRWALSDGN